MNTAINPETSTLGDSSDDESKSAKPDVLTFSNIVTLKSIDLQV